jgi:hypothetical protein
MHANAVRSAVRIYVDDLIASRCCFSDEILLALLVIVVCSNRLLTWQIQDRLNVCVYICNLFVRRCPDSISYCRTQVHGALFSCPPSGKNVLPFERMVLRDHADVQIVSVSTWSSIASNALHINSNSFVDRGLLDGFGTIGAIGK